MEARYHRVFVLCTGRCGSTTFAAACGRFDGWTTGHESRKRTPLLQRLEYPTQHIEVDNRLVWFAPLLANKYRGSLFVHLTRNREETIRSFARRPHSQILRSFHAGQLWNHPEDATTEQVATAYVDAANAMARTLVDRYEGLTISIEECSGEATGFVKLWKLLGKPFDPVCAMAQFQHRLNSSPADT